MALPGRVRTKAQCSGPTEAAQGSLWVPRAHPQAAGSLPLFSQVSCQPGGSGWGSSALPPRARRLAHRAFHVRPRAEAERSQGHLFP